MNRLTQVVAGLIGGVLFSYLFQTAAEATAINPSKPVYVVVSAQVQDPDGLAAYAEAARPVAQQAGLEVLGRIESVPDELVFEGSWPHPGGLTVERFESMEAFEAFWNSEAYQRAIPLREGKVNINFVVAVPAS